MNGILLVFNRFYSIHDRCFLPKDRSFTANARTKTAVLFEGSPIVNSGIKAAVLLGINRCGSFPLFSAPHL